MRISAIVAVARNGVIGRDNQIPWYLPADLKFFKRTTLHHHVIMGRRSFLSIGRPLPKRTNIVVTRDPFFVASGVLIAHSVEEALLLARQAEEKEAFIIGGSQIYAASMPYWHRLYLTEVDTEPEGDTFFPEMEWSEWQLVKEERHEPDDRNEFGYTFKILDRRQPPQAWDEEE